MHLLETKFMICKMSWEFKSWWFSINNLNWLSIKKDFKEIRFFWNEIYSSLKVFILYLFPPKWLDILILARIKMSNHFGGNRYRIKTFKEEYISFQKNLISLKSFLIDNQFKLLIENHQDLNSHDILHIINFVSNKCIY